MRPSRRARQQYLPQNTISYGPVSRPRSVRIAGRRGVKQRTFCHCQTKMQRAALCVAEMPGKAWQYRRTSSLKRRDYRPVVFVVNEFPRGGAAQRGHQLAKRRGAHVVSPRGYEIRIRRIGDFDDQRVPGWVEPRGERVVGVDEGEVHIVQDSWQGGRLELPDLQMPGVDDHIVRRSHDVGWVLVLVESLSLLMQQGARGVVGGVGDGNHSAVAKLRH